MLNISEDRVKHSLSVGKLMYQLSKNKGWLEEKCQDMFILGYLHDIGYEFSENQNEHPKKGGLLLKQQNYPYWQEVYYHGLIDIEYKSKELDLLNYADMSIDSKGNNVGFLKRLEDIEIRYGVDSKQYKDARKIVETLRW